MISHSLQALGGVFLVIVVVSLIGATVSAFRHRKTTSTQSPIGVSGNGGIDRRPTNPGNPT